MRPQNAHRVHAFPESENPLKPSLSILAALCACLSLSFAAQAQTAAPRPVPKATTKPAAKAPAKKPAVAAPAAPVLPPAEGEQLAAAALILYGDYQCDFEQTAKVAPTPSHDGYVDVHFKNQTWTMKPVLSSTGALRLEDVTGRMLALQIANKSMLMDTKTGQRVVDGCTHEKQRAAVAAAAGMPPSNVLLQGIGDTPAKP
jgi:hypothetical protein